MDNICKKCLLSETNEEAVLESIKIRIARLSEGERSSDELYKERLALCKNCEYLVCGVCQKCGCYVEFRAAFKKQRCPDVSGKKW